MEGKKRNRSMVLCSDCLEPVLKGDARRCSRCLKPFCQNCRNAMDGKGLCGNCSGEPVGVCCICDGPFCRPLLVQCKNHTHGCLYLICTGCLEDATSGECPDCVKKAENASDVDIPLCITKNITSKKDSSECPACGGDLVMGICINCIPKQTRMTRMMVINKKRIH